MIFLSSRVIKSSFEKLVVLTPCFFDLVTKELLRTKSENVTPFLALFIVLKSSKMCKLLHKKEASHYFSKNIQIFQKNIPWKNAPSEMKSPHCALVLSSFFLRFTIHWGSLGSLSLLQNRDASSFHHFSCDNSRKALIQGCCFNSRLLLAVPFILALRYWITLAHPLHL